MLFFLTTFNYIYTQFVMRQTMPIASYLQKGGNLKNNNRLYYWLETSGPFQMSAEEESMKICSNYTSNVWWVETQDKLHKHCLFFVCLKSQSLKAKAEHIQSHQVEKEENLNGWPWRNKWKMSNRRQIDWSYWRN